MVTKQCPECEAKAVVVTRTAPEDVFSNLIGFSSNTMRSYWWCQCGYCEVYDDADIEAAEKWGKANAELVMGRKRERERKAREEE